MGKRHLTMEEQRIAQEIRATMGKPCILGNARLIAQSVASGAVVVPCGKCGTRKGYNVRDGFTFNCACADRKPYATADDLLTCLRLAQGR